MPLPFSVNPIIVVNEGASFGPRVATGTFGLEAPFRKPRLSVSIAADVDGRQYQDESAVRRRAGRAAVPVGRRAAAAIASGALAPEVGRPRGEPPFATAVWSYEEIFEGFSRRVRVVADWPCPDVDDVAPPLQLVAAAGDRVRQLADQLHVAIDDPANVAVFGGR